MPPPRGGAIRPRRAKRVHRTPPTPSPGAHRRARCAGQMIDRSKHLTDTGNHTPSASRRPSMSARTKAPATSAARVAAVRRFNRFYTRLVGALDEGGYLHSPFTLTEGRVLFELAQRDAPTASTLVSELGLDAGYLSRLLQRLQRRRLVSRARSPHDGRESHISLTAAGRAA